MMASFRIFVPRMVVAILISILLSITTNQVSAKHTNKNDAKPQKQPSDYLVKGLEDIEPAFATFNGTMYAGMVPITPPPTTADEDHNYDGEYMFWLFIPDDPIVDDSVVIWLNGGPGCTSFNAGLLFETAPVTTGPLDAGSCCIDKDAPLKPNEHAWTQATIMLYVEQPVGTGFSHGEHQPKNEEELSLAFYYFLLNFYDVFENLAEKRLFFFGESYAGMYVPSIARQIHVQNKKNDNKEENANDNSSLRRHINLAGIGLGNGLIDVTQQTTPMIDFAYYHGLIDSKQREHFYQEWEHCYTPGKEDAELLEPEPYHSFTVPDECGIMTAIAIAAGKNLIKDRSLNVYDVTTWDPYSSLSHVKHGVVLDSTNTRFFNNPLIKKALNAPDETYWMGCMPGQGRRRQRRTRKLEQDNNNKNNSNTIQIPTEKLLDQDRPISMAPYISELLDDAGIEVLVYNGDRDMACCAQGSEIVLNNMEWSGSHEWNNNENARGLWIVDNEMAGYVKSIKNLNFVIVYNSGHMVPTNQPINALDLVIRLISQKTFNDAATPTFAYSNIQNKLKERDNDNGNDKTNQEEEEKVEKVNNAMGNGHFWVTHVLSSLICLAIGVGVGFVSARRGYKYTPLP